MDRQLRKKVSLKKVDHFFALGFGSGLIPAMPGTFGSLAAIPLLLLLSFVSTEWYLLVTLIACIAGVRFCGKTSDALGLHDHGAIVWDEIAGMLVTMLFVPLVWQNVLIGFILFRFFDILKPWPISALDRRVHGGTGIMLDDIVAGLIACGLIHIGFQLELPLLVNGL
ncbi:phosphatidylglycerophosphatase A family protein [Agaribacter marinus]|uniref:Phosphatidylglycerophosphatase A n=1 Tax=Agaribacter marinus TaxID=1431249 RepID=A0AA37WK76_9ALTE|nr:phosphatidylglycerophosphatase A [Agaribacter marinus]GLR73067.1 phosphatidylglycerophosphatase A [Agaribacter marinus]